MVAPPRTCRPAVLLLALLVACGGGTKESKEGDAPAPAAKPADGIETSWSGYVSKRFPGTLGETVEAVKSALRGLELEVTGESGGVFEKSLDAEAGDGTSLVVSVKEVGKDQTRVSVKVGYLLGDGDAARRILSEIDGRMAAAKLEAEERRRRWKPSGTGVGMTPTTVTSTTTTSTTLPGRR